MSQAGAHVTGTNPVQMSSCSDTLITFYTRAPRPRHGHLDHLRAAQNRPNRVHTLLEYDKTTGANPGLPESDATETSNSG